MVILRLVYFLSTGGVYGDFSPEWQNEHSALASAPVPTS
jgi:hypothetical protein